MKEVKSACVRALKDEGGRFRYGIITFQISEGFLAWVGLNAATYTDYIEINPFVGIHWVPVMLAEQTASGEKYREGEFATYAIHIGELAPFEKVFRFRSESDLSPVAERLSELVMRVGLPGNHPTK
jgi:hypothetical protein